MRMGHHAELVAMTLGIGVDYALLLLRNIFTDALTAIRWLEVRVKLLADREQD